MWALGIYSASRRTSEGLSTVVVAGAVTEDGNVRADESWRQPMRAWQPLKADVLLKPSKRGARQLY